MNPLEIVKAAKTKLANPKAWIKGSLARDKSGRQVNPVSPDAVCWCLIGAMHSVNTGSPSGCVVGTEAYDAIRVSTPNHWPWLQEFNDCEGTTHADVIETLDRAIASLGGVP